MRHRNRFAVAIIALALTGCTPAPAFDAGLPPGSACPRGGLYTGPCAASDGGVGFCWVDDGGVTGVCCQTRDGNREDDCGNGWVKP